MVERQGFWGELTLLGQAAGIASGRERFQRMRIATSSRWAMLARWLVPAVAAAVVLAPAQALASGGAGLPVASYGGCHPANCFGEKLRRDLKAVRARL